MFSTLRMVPAGGRWTLIRPTLAAGESAVGSLAKFQRPKFPVPQSSGYDGSRASKGPDGRHQGTKNINKKKCIVEVP